MGCWRDYEDCDVWTWEDQAAADAARAKAGRAWRWSIHRGRRAHRAAIRSRRRGGSSEGVHAVTRGPLRRLGAEDALARLYWLAQALGNDYERFEEFVGRGAGGGEVVPGMTTEALVPAARVAGDRDRWGRGLPTILQATVRVGQ